MHHEYMLKFSSCHLEGVALSMVNKCFKSMVDGWVKCVWLEEKLTMAVEVV